MSYETIRQKEEMVKWIRSQVKFEDYSEEMQQFLGLSENKQPHIFNYPMIQFQNTKSFHHKIGDGNTIKSKWNPIYKEIQDCVRNNKPWPIVPFDDFKRKISKKRLNEDMIRRATLH